jgi:hypothetical protein
MSAAPDEGAARTPADLRYRRMVTALHARGPRPCGEVLAAALARLDPADRDAVLDLAEEIIRWSPQMIAALGARDFPRPPHVRVS